MREMYTDVCIVGAGPAGVVLGLLLAQQGHEVILLERASDLIRDYRGEILQPTTLQLFDEIGLLPLILEQPYKRIEQGGIYYKNKRIMNFTLRELSQSYPYALQMNQAALLESLLSKAKQFPNFSIHFRSSINHLLKDAKEQVIGVQGVMEKEEVRILAKVTVGSDGRQSVLREQSGFQKIRNHHRSDLIWFTVDWPAHLPHELMYFLTGKNNLFMIPKYPEQMQIGYTFQKEELSRVRKNNHQEIKELVLRHVPELKEQLEQTKPFVKLDVISITLAQWTQDGFVLIGDAAHVMTPIGVIGINVAIADAIEAGATINQALKIQDFSKNQLEKIEKSRKTETDRIQDLQIKVEALIFTTNPWVVVIRPYLIGVISKTPLAKLIMKKFFFPKQ